MMDEVNTTGDVMLLALLFGCLIGLQRYRLDGRRERAWVGHGMNFSDVNQRMELVRHDYVAKAHTHPKFARRHGELVTEARKRIRNRTYFRRQEDALDAECVHA